MNPPDGFSPIFRVSPVIEMIGPVYSRGEGLALELGMFAQAKHCNLRGSVHGGIFATLADMALGYTLAFSSDPPKGFVTANLTVDYAGSANVGDWLTTRTDVQRQGGRLAFANCYIYVREQRIVRASAVFLAQEWRSATRD
ncbi:MAG: PaaI family thioesterase [Steroidobacter sp.]